MSRIEDALARAEQLRKMGARPGVPMEDSAAVRESAAMPEPAVLAEPERGPRADFAAGSRAVGYLGLLGVILLPCCGVYRFSTFAGTGSHVQGLPEFRRAEASPAAAQPAPQGLRLPSSLPLDRPDLAYAAAHPGWQRYLARSVEFRVFREGETAKALQVLSLPGHTISREFLGSLLGGASFQAQSSEDKGGYRIERGATKDRLEVAVYREKASGGSIRAVVVAGR